MRLQLSLTFTGKIATAIKAGLQCVVNENKSYSYSRRAGGISLVGALNTMLSPWLYWSQVPLPHFHPMPLSRAHAPFSHPDCLFEIKWGGFRALLYSDKLDVRVVSRNGNTFKTFPGLCEGLARDLKGPRNPVFIYL